MAITGKLRMKETLTEGIDRLVASLQFYCDMCGEERKAHVFASGHVIDLKEGQDLEGDNIIIDKERKVFINLYLVPEAGIPEIRSTREGIDAITSSIAEGHATQFHNGKAIVSGRN